MIHPTPYAELNGVLAYLLEGAKACLGRNFVGAYLQGSFAVGDHTPWSDCDFIIVTERDIRSGELAPLQALHKCVHALDAPYWRNGLEGSYAPAEILRRWSLTPRDPPGEPRAADWADPGLSGSPPRTYPFWYLDHGSDTLVRSEHDNTRVVRWCLREKGIVLEGPDPRDLIDPVMPDDLRDEVRATMRQVLAVDLQPMHLSAWQAFWVGLCCRMLYTLEHGEVASKKVSMAWAQDALEPRWRALIGAAAALRKGDPESSELPVTPHQEAATRAFAAYAAARMGI